MAWHSVVIIKNGFISYLFEKIVLSNNIPYNNQCIHRNAALLFFNFVKTHFYLVDFYPSTSFSFYYNISQAIEAIDIYFLN